MSNLDTLYQKDSHGEIRYWKTWTEGADICTEYGVEGGTPLYSRKTAEAVNVGKSNETTPEAQAQNESVSMWQYKLDRKYSRTKSEARVDDNNLPMLAHKYEGSKKNKLRFPAHVQPKLDGVRCIAKKENGIVTMTSRSNKPWNVPHIRKALEKALPEGWCFDGEIYIHGASCQKITSLVRSADPTKKSYKPQSEDLVLHIYDIPYTHDTEGSMWSHRVNNLLKLNGLVLPLGLESVETLSADDDADLQKVSAHYVALGYEGVIIRGLGGVYTWGKRSSDLLKFKKFQDAEFMVLSADEGKGKMAGKVIFICQNDLNGENFSCTMKCSLAEREKYYTNYRDYVGRMLTVKFFDRTDDNKPRFPVGITFRDPKDLP